MGATHQLLVTHGAAGGGGSGHRYWRILITQNDGSASFCGFTECELRGTVGGSDLTSAASALACTLSSSDINSGNAARYAFSDDGNGWLSATASTSWIRWDFQTQGIGQQNVVQIRIEGSHNAPNASPRNFELQWSDDGSSWTTVMTVTGATGWTGAGDWRTFTV